MERVDASLVQGNGIIKGIDGILVSSQVIIGSAAFYPSAHVPGIDLYRFGIGGDGILSLAQFVECITFPDPDVPQGWI